MVQKKWPNLVKFTDLNEPAIICKLTDDTAPKELFTGSFLWHKALVRDLHLVLSAAALGCPCQMLAGIKP